LDAQPPIVEIEMPASTTTLSIIGDEEVGGGSQPNGTPNSATLETVFRSLVASWKSDTAHMSDATRMAMHPAYLQIIGLGRRALPLILRELKAEPDHWFIALFAITRYDAAVGSRTFKDAVQAWLEWGEKNELL
jgi:hypothetical protein